MKSFACQLIPECQGAYWFNDASFVSRVASCRAFGIAIGRAGGRRVSVARDWPAPDIALHGQRDFAISSCPCWKPKQPERAGSFGTIQVETLAPTLSTASASSRRCRPVKVPVFSRRSAVTQMSQPPQPKATSSDHNGVSVIQSQSHAAGAASALLQQVPQPSPLSQASSPGAGKAAPGKMKKASADKDSDEYRQRRERNNLAVKKSRQRSKQKAMDTQQRVNQLKEENERLEAKIKLLSKELSVLKDLFLEHAHNLADNVQPPSGNPEASPAPNNQ
ncbi:CCAAT/enhancer-binding protein gamma isoform 1-T1 [Syngnathus typhle]